VNHSWPFENLNKGKKDKGMVLDIAPLNYER